jgi:ribosomal protein L7Ae-like RNA K-turn-binding protein
MPERKLTGGSKEFSYSKEDAERIRSTDTESTKAFKAAYKDWQVKRGEERIEEELQAQRFKLMLIAIGLTLAAVLLIIISLLQ